MDERLFTVEEVADHLATTRETVRRWIKDGKLGAFMPGGQKLGYRIPASELERLTGRRGRITAHPATTRQNDDQRSKMLRELEQDAARARARGDEAAAGRYEAAIRAARGA